LVVLPIQVEPCLLILLRVFPCFSTVLQYDLWQIVALQYKYLCFALEKVVSCLSLIF
jgi:hypothetical protein